MEASSPLDPRFPFIALALLLACDPATAWESSVELYGGYRQDNLSWSIAGIDGSPNILSELSFDDVVSLEVGVDLDLRAPVGFEAEIALRYGEIVDGSNRDSDYMGDDRTGEWSRSDNAVDDDDVWDTSVGIGWGIDWTDRRSGRSARFTPMIGYAINQQNLRLSDGVQTIPPSGSFPGLDSTYQSEWRGPWIGLHSLYEGAPRWQLGLDLEFHWGDYEAVADWNLRTDLQHPRSFEHDADGRGLRLLLEGIRQLGRRSDLTLRLGLEDWETDAGTDRIYLADGSVVSTRFNGAQWQSLSLDLGWRYRF
jgi:hypothetical protein